MNIPSEAVSIEQRVRDAGVGVKSFLDAAGIDRSTWGRWKSGRFTPRLSNWLKVCATADEITANAQQEPAE